MRFVALSDTHGFHPRIEVPDGDVLLHAGDCTNQGRLHELEDFNRFLEGLPHTHKVVIAGNHDFCFERQPEESAQILTAATYLLDGAVEIEGIKIYGSPWQPEFFDWAFNLPRGPELARKWAAIPGDTDILMTHGPPQGILDETSAGDAVGCADLLERLADLSVKVHLFGHIHEGYGEEVRGGTRYLNASILDHIKRRLNRPWVFDL